MRALAALALAALALAGPAEAQRLCTVRDRPLEFDDYHLSRPTATRATGYLELHCPGNNPPPPATVSLSTGNSGHYFPRTMSANRHSSLDYNIYADLARQQVAGDGSSGTVHLLGIPTGEVVIYPIFGAIPPRQPANPGHYDDRIVVTVEF
jgi:spore coat protein U-like protein